MILTITQARLGSARLPGKILMNIAGKPILQHVIDAAPEPKVVAMPLSERVGFIIDCQELAAPLKGDVCWYDGDVNDVLGRFYHAWQDYKPAADWILRLTADCPMLTRGMVDRFISTVLKAPGLQPGTLYTNRPWDPDGYDMELFSTKALAMAHEYSTDPYDREHVTPWLYRHLNVRRFSIFGREMGPEKAEEKVSVDTQQDYEKVRRLINE